MLDKSWVCVYTTIYAHEIPIAKAILGENNIEAIEISKRDSAYLFGDIEIYVKKENELTAIQIIKKMKSDFFEN